MLKGQIMGDISKYKCVGAVSTEIAAVKNFNYPGNIYAAPGLLKHIKKHRKEFSPTVLSDLENVMSTIVNDPDYVGCDPSKSGISLELVKDIGGNILVALEFDIKDNYIYVSSMYPISTGKLTNRINSNRLIKL